MNQRSAMQAFSFLWFVYSSKVFAETNVEATVDKAVMTLAWKEICILQLHHNTGNDRNWRQEHHFTQSMLAQVLKTKYKKELGKRRFSDLTMSIASAVWSILRPLKPSLKSHHWPKEIPSLSQKKSTLYEVLARWHTPSHPPIQSLGRRDIRK